MAAETPQKLVPAVQNAASILRLLATRGQPMTATNISRDTGLNGSSAFNILRTLTHEGFTVFDSTTKTYRLGLELLNYVTPLLGVSPVELIRPMLMEIAQEHQTMIALWQITDGERIVLIDNISSARIVQARIAPGSRLPAFSGAIGRCYCAAQGLKKSAAKAGFQKIRWQKAPSFESYWQDVCAARESNYAFDRGDLFRGLEIGATLARNAAGTPRFGLSNITISGQLSQEEQLKVIHDLVKAAGRIETAIYGRPPDEHTTK